ncbi:MAG: ComEA family DNA-binding protein [Caldilineae bacterium]|nr:MAG: ComEA family DNA-binding protein [Caldilineae bacterium]
MLSSPSSQPPLPSSTLPSPTLSAPSLPAQAEPLDVGRKTSTGPEKVVPLTPLLTAQLFALGAVTATVLMGLFLLLTRQPDPPPITLHPPPPPAPTAAPEPTATPGPVTVFVSGAVAHPGLYTLPWNARVGDALAAAGGLLEDVDAAVVNQAERLFDGAQVHVPTQEEPTPGEAASPPPGLSGAPIAGPATSPDGRVNLNTASAEELMSLPGIGASKAAAIIANRPYASPDELTRVPGIGPKTLEQLRELITTQ